MSIRRIAVVTAALGLSSCGSPAAAPAPAVCPTVPAPGGSVSQAAPAASPAQAASPASASPSAGPAAPVSAPAALASSPPRARAPELVLAEPSPAPKVVPVLAIVAPRKNQVVPAKTAASFAIKLSAKSFELGARGDHLCVVLDRRPCRRVDDLGTPLTLADLDPAIDEGQHVLSIIARRGSGEFVRSSGKRAPFASHSFYVGKKVPPVWKDGAPMLFFSAPPDGPAPPEGVLIDYYVANADIAPGGYVVHASVGGPGITQGVGLSIDAPRPLRLRHAQPGEHLARLSLFGYQSELGESRSSTTVMSTSRPVPGAFSEVTRTFRVQAAR